VQEKGPRSQPNSEPCTLDRCLVNALSHLDGWISAWTIWLATMGMERLEALGI
jgi:hypothetical protein